MKKNENQFIKLPTKKSSEQSDLTPEEEFIYIGLRSFMNENTKQCNPSYRRIADKLHINCKDTIGKYLQSLEKKKYIKIIDNGPRKSKDYLFIKDLPNFEKFKPEFIESDDLTFQQKSFLTAVQRLQFKDEESGLGNISYQLFEISDKINTSASIVNKRIKELESKGIVNTTELKVRDKESGLKKIMYSFDLSKYNPIIKVLVKHELDIQDIISVLTPEQQELIMQKQRMREIIL